MDKYSIFLSLMKNFFTKDTFMKLKLVFLSVFLLLSANSFASSGKIKSEIDRLRGIKSVPGKAAEINKKLDAVWKILGKNKKKSIPIVKKELISELGKKRPDQFFILDMAYFLTIHDKKKSQKITIKALDKINSNAEIIQVNFQEFIFFAHNLAKTQNPAILPLIDKHFLNNEQSIDIFKAPHYIKLNPFNLRIFFYGIFGEKGEKHLISRMKKRRKEVTKILEILGYIGSMISVPFVSTIVQKPSNYDEFIRAFGFLMRFGGTAGKKAVLNISPKHLDKRSKTYYKKAKPQVKMISFKLYADSFKKMPPSPPKKRTSDKAIKKKLKIMYQNYGVDKDTHPFEILNSTLPKKYLITQLLKIRTRMFFRLNNHAIDDVVMTNKIINTLYFRKK